MCPNLNSSSWQRVDCSEDIERLNAIKPDGTGYKIAISFPASADNHWTEKVADEDQSNQFSGSSDSDSDQNGDDRSDPRQLWTPDGSDDEPEIASTKFPPMHAVRSAIGKGGKSFDVNGQVQHNQLWRRVQRIYK